MICDESDESFYSASDLSNSFHSFNDSTELSLVGSLLNCEFQKNPFHFNVCHINAQSITSHYTDFIDTFSSCELHAILISESWLKPVISSTSCPLPGFVLLRNDRTGKGGGGVAIYLRSDITYKLLSSSPSLYSGSMEHLIIEVSIRGASIVLGVIYCPPTINYFSSFENLLLDIGTECTHHIIMGDFNTDLLKVNSRSRLLRSAIDSADFSLTPLNATHRNTDCPDSWLDVMLTSRPDYILNSGQLLAPGFSRHDLIFLTYKIKTPKPEPEIVHLRSFARLDIDRLSQDALSADWAAVFDASSVDTKTSHFNSMLIKLFDAHAPVRAVKVKRPPAPWITRGVRLAMSRRDKAFRIFKRDRCDNNWLLFKAARNRCNQMVRAAKRRYIHDNVISSSLADTWKFLKSLGVGKTKPAVDCSIFSLDELNTHFSTSSTLNSLIKSNTLSLIASFPSPDIAPFTFTPVTDEEIRKIVMSIRSKAIGHDNVSRAMVTLILDCILPVITHIINSSLLTGVFPSCWRKAYVIPLPKIASPTSLNHFRPISILPFLSKVLEAAAHKQVSKFIQYNNLLSQFQSGFRPGHSTSTALLNVIEDIRWGMESTKVTVLVLIDFSNAFNVVDHDLLLATLTHLRISSSAIEWFSSYLCNRVQAVRANRSLSDWCDLSTGVPQGGILSPLLFSIFINLITAKIRSSYHLYADDLQLYTHAEVKDVNCAVALINEDLERIAEWSKSFGICVNPNKCQAIFIGSHRQLSRLESVSVSPIIFDGSIIPVSERVKDLGLILDSNLSWHGQITEVSRKVSGTLRYLYKYKNFLPVSTKKLLVQTLILPIIDYADVCTTNISQESLNKLDRLLNNGIRFIFGLRKYDHVSCFRRQLNWLSIRRRRAFRILCSLFSIIFEPSAPEYLKCKFPFTTPRPGCSLRSSRTLKLSIPSHYTTFMSNSFTVQAIRLWNSLPLSIRQAPSKFVFKRMLRKHLLKEEFG